MPGPSSQLPAIALLTKALLMLVVRAWAISLEVFLRRGFGSRYFGLQAALVLLLVPSYALIWEGQDLRPIFLFLVGYVVLSAFARIGMLFRVLRGDQRHSFYSGWPRLLNSRSRFCEIKVKKFVEPFVVLAIGGLIGNHNPPLAIYLVLASFCLTMTAHASDNWIRRRAMEMNDALLDQQHIAERFHDLRHGRF
jgi:hypothetical protein